MSENNQTKIIGMGLVGAAIGGAVGYFAFFWVTRHGFYAMVLPGGLLGFGAGLCARGRSIPLAVICCAAALALSLVTQWRFAPFIADPGFGYFIAHVSALSPVTLVMIGLGTFLGYRLALETGEKPETQAAQP